MTLSTIGNVLLPASTLAVAPILAQTLGVSARGELAGATAPALLAVALAAGGLPDAVAHFVARAQHSARSAQARGALLSVGYGLVASVIIIVTAPLIAAGNESLEQLIRLTAIALVPTLLVGLARGVASGRRSWGLVSVEKLVTALARVASIYVLAFSGGLTVLTATIATLAAPIIGGAAYLTLWLGKRESKSVPAIPFRTIATFGGKVWAGAVAGIVLARIDQVLLTPLAGPVELGLYAVAVNLGEVPIIVTSALAMVLFTEDSAKTNDVRLGRFSRIASASALAIAVVVGLASPWILPVLFGSEFAAALPCALILILAAVVGTPGSFAGVALSARGRPEIRSAALIVGAAANVVILILAAPAWGATGAAIATLAGSAIAGVINVVALWRLHGVAPSTLVAVRWSDFRQLAHRARSRSSHD